MKILHEHWRKRTKIQEKWMIDGFISLEYLRRYQREKVEFVSHCIILIYSSEFLLGKWEGIFYPLPFPPKNSCMHVDFSVNFASVAGKQAHSNQQKHVLRILPPFLTKAQPMQARLSLKFGPFFAFFHLWIVAFFQKKSESVSTFILKLCIPSVLGREKPLCCVCCRLCCYFWS